MGVMRKLVFAFKISYRAQVAVEAGIQKIINVLWHKGNTFHSNFISEVIPAMSDNALAEFAVIIKVMDKQVLSQQKLRSSKIYGIHQTILMMNAFLNDDKTTQEMAEIHVDLRF